MIPYTVITIFLLLFSASSTESRSGQITQHVDNDNSFRSQISKSFDAVVDFLSSWFASVRQTLVGIITNAIDDGNSAPVFVIQRRQVTPPQNFEEIEKLYLYNMAMDDLKQFAGYVEYLQDDNDTRSYLGEMVRNQGEKLRHMSADEMRKYVGSVLGAMTDGVNTKHEITINGERYSLDSISSWCCPF